MNDPINHPDHYNHGSLEVIDAIDGLGLDKDFYLGNVLKYIARSAHTGKELQDLEKAMSYLKRKLRRVEGSNITIDVKKINDLIYDMLVSELDDADWILSAHESEIMIEKGDRVITVAIKEDGR